MADVTPTPISEITNIQGDPRLGASILPLPKSNVAEYVLEAAKARDNANRYIAQQHEQRLKDVIDQVNKMDYSGALSSDIPAISNRMSGIFGDIANNYDAIINPSANIDKYTQLAGDLNGLQGQIDTSKAHNAIYNDNLRTLQLHPEWNTDENQQMMNNFVNTPIDQRKNFLLKQPTSFDPTVYGNATAALTKNKIDADHISKSGNYIINNQGEAYDPTQWVNTYKNLLTSTIHNNKSGIQELQGIYNQMPTDSDGNKISFDDFVNHTALSSLPNGFHYTTIKANPVAEAQQRINEEYWAKKQDIAVEYAKMAQTDKALKANEIKPEEGAEAKNLALYNALKGNGLAPEFGQNIYGSDPLQAVTVKIGGDPIFEDNPATGQKDYKGTSPVTTQKIPAKEFVSSAPDGHGGLINTYKINALDPKTGQLQSKVVKENRSYGELTSDFNRIYGSKFVPAIASGSSTFNKAKMKVTNPAYEDLDKYFSNPNVGSTGTPKEVAPTNIPPVVAPVSPTGGMSQELYDEFLRKNGLK